jgi:hypothetical protein
MRSLRSPSLQGGEYVTEISGSMDNDVGSGSIEDAKIGAGGGNRTHGLGIMRPSLFH